MQSFATLGVRAPLVAVLEGQGIDEPFPVQALTLPDALAGRDVCGKANTGSGKTLAFALPLVQRLEWKPKKSPRGLVLVPTRELAQQVLAVVRPIAEAVGLKALAVYGGASMEKQTKVARQGVDIVVATPGRLIDLVERDIVSLKHVQVAVVDEADRMADMGFLPQVEWLLRQFDGKQRAQMLLFSATLDKQIEGLVRTYLRDPVRHEVMAETESAADLQHYFFSVHQMDRVRVAAAMVRSTFRTIIFVRTKRGADRLAGQLQREGVTAEAIHGDLRQSARDRALRNFAAGKTAALVATDVAARGIHVDDIDVVIHFDLPEDHKAYVHRSGRTARAGRTGAVATFVLWNQVVEVERLKKRLGVQEETVEVFSNDPRLAELASFRDGVAAAS